MAGPQVISIFGLICKPAQAKKLNTLDAYTATLQKL